AIVLGVVGVTLGPAPGDLVFVREGEQFLPEFGVLDRLLLLGPPAVALPADDPGGDAILDIFAVGDHRHAAATVEQAQPPDGGAQLHPVVGGRRIGPGSFAAVPAGEEDDPPAAWAGVALARAISVDRDRRQRGDGADLCRVAAGRGAIGG